MIAALATVAVLALAPAAEAGFSRPLSEKFGFPSKGSRPRNTGFKTTTRTRRSSAKCGATSYAKSFQTYKDAHVTAVKKAWLYACTAKVGEFYWADIYNEIENSKGAYAFAKAVTEVYGSCTVRGRNAYGCAAAYSYATAWADAVATSHAAAWAEAVGQCECGVGTTIVAAESDGYATESAYLAADVKSLSEGYICHATDARRGGRGRRTRPSTKKFHQSQTCLENVYATVLARAVAKAAIDGQCVHDYSNQSERQYAEYTADAYTEATAEITLEHIYGCVPYVSGFNPYH